MAPVDELTVAAEVLSEVHVPPASPLVVIVTVDPILSAVFPLNVPAFGVATMSTSNELVY